MVAEYGGSCPHVRVLHILQPGWPRQHQESGYLEQPLVATILVTVTSTNRIGVLDARVTGKGHSEVQGSPLV